MPLRRKHSRHADATIISSSSDTSEASEDNALDCDVDSSSDHDGYADKSGGSGRQTMKLNSGRFGMFNPPTLTPRTPHMPNSRRKKRKRAQEYSDYSEAARSSRRTQRKQRDKPEAMELDYEGEDEQSLFIPDNGSQSQPIVVDDQSEDEEHLYNDMTPERARKVKEYLNTLDLVETADKNLHTAEQELSTATTEHTSLSWQLASIDATAENEISDIIRERDEAIRIANEFAETKIKRIGERLPAKRESYEGRLQEYVERKKAAEKCHLEMQTELQSAKEKKDELERQGGFELCSDVREVQARAKSKRR